jgi:hypothetical protein
MYTRINDVVCEAVPRRYKEENWEQPNQFCTGVCEDGSWKGAAIQRGLERGS